MRLTTLLLLSLIVMQAYSQNYTRDAGLRGGPFPGITYRQYTSNDHYAEVMISLQRNSIRVSFLKEFVKPAFQELSKHLYLIYGFGAHSGFNNADHYRILNRTYFYNGNRFSPVFGIDGYMGFEYRFQKAPFIAGIDIKPFFEYSTNQFFNLALFDTALSIKFKF